MKRADHVIEVLIIYPKLPYRSGLQPELTRNYDIQSHLVRNASRKQRSYR
jgi:hypothetical protein